MIIKLSSDELYNIVKQYMEAVSCSLDVQSIHFSTAGGSAEATVTAWDKDFVEKKSTPDLGEDDDD